MRNLRIKKVKTAFGICLVCAAGVSAKTVLD